MVMPAKFSFVGSKLMTKAGVKLFCMTVLVLPSMMSQYTSTSESNENSISKLDARMFFAFGVAKNFGNVSSGAGGGGGFGGGGGARAATAVGGTILDMLDNPALVS